MTIYVNLLNNIFCSKIAACSGISDKKKAAFETCAASDAVANSEEKTVDALVAAIVAAEGKEDKIEALKTMCEYVWKRFLLNLRHHLVGQCHLIYLTIQFDLVYSVC